MSENLKSVTEVRGDPVRKDPVGVRAESDLTRGTKSLLSERIKTPTSSSLYDFHSKQSAGNPHTESIHSSFVNSQRSASLADMNSSSVDQDLEQFFVDDVTPSLGSDIMNQSVSSQQKAESATSSNPAPKMMSKILRRMKSRDSKEFTAAVSESSQVSTKDKLKKMFTKKEGIVQRSASFKQTKNPPGKNDRASIELSPTAALAELESEIKESATGNSGTGTTSSFLLRRTPSKKGISDEIVILKEELEEARKRTEMQDRDIRKLFEEKKKMKELESSLRMELAKAESKVAELEAEPMTSGSVDSVSNDVSKKIIADLKASRDELNAQKSQIEEELEVARRMNLDLMQQKSQSERDMATLREKFRLTSSEKDQVEKSLKKLKFDVDAASTEHAAVLERLNAEGQMSVAMKAELERLKEDSAKRLASDLSEIEAKKKELEAIQAELANANQELSLMASSLEVSKTMFTDKQAELTEVQKEIQVLKAVSSERQQALGDEIKALKQKLADDASEISSLQSEKAFLMSQLQTAAESEKAVKDLLGAKVLELEAVQAQLLKLTEEKDSSTAVASREIDFGGQADGHENPKVYVDRQTSSSDISVPSSDKERSTSVHPASTRVYVNRQVSAQRSEEEPRGEAVIHASVKEEKASKLGNSAVYISFGVSVFSILLALIFAVIAVVFQGRAVMRNSV